MNQLNANRRKPVVKLTAEDIVGPQGPGRLIRCLYRQMVSLSEAQFPETDLSFIHWLSLMLVHDGVVVTAGDLAKETMMTTGAITRLVDVLEDRRLLIRDRCAARRYCATSAASKCNACLAPARAPASPLRKRALSPSSAQALNSDT